MNSIDPQLLLTIINIHRSYIPWTFDVEGQELDDDIAMDTKERRPFGSMAKKATYILNEPLVNPS